MRAASLLARTLARSAGSAAEGVQQQVRSVASSSAAVTTTAAGAEAGQQRGSYAAAMGGMLAGVFGASTVASAGEVEDGLHAPSYPWPHEGIFDSYDHSSIRRGHQVYQQVCAACHSMHHLHWRQLVGVAYTEDEVKALAAETEVEDGPNDEGEMYLRPGRLADKLPSPYANEQAARYANGGAYPPDLSLIAGARHNGQNYIFALLTGYREPPAGVNVRTGLYYNPYFPGGSIAMPKMLVDGGAEYDDGTPASESQQAKDVTTFLTWSGYPFQDEMRLMGIKACLVLTAMIAFCSYSKRLRWAPLKSQRIIVNTIN
uniref:Cytochrome c domain-containing protein n=2 Tax=Dunaliella tertiolecta TaxID=3047 RepID=A0A7S3VM99_DUNTE|mmetsp:Transcript_16856/g.44095  ORF Transcript_16856/g.44095 Transcript_16856/m.44095 type:complete len:316 (+) Transcript_16856:1399-2346(+)|eukprot:CAMPEP_0202380218 /NCGR_PEP_ID=MMETSP1127-20130417/27644_1 /ASSEMBLY_ACC=CAM_ASM_000462 /TAXON_ID=3047 /ORGANISM="Dunaliella tertiolecta, Strain CCMP1320" /LENGTH=315 /DNA_ID=CAMNT_0048978875 /DNA_START=125 /DNA_END=1072 /DNA_ORIENTATION=-